MEIWNNIYNHFDPVAFSVGGFNMHWYGIMYVLALLIALAMAKFFAKRDSYAISDKLLDNYFFWVEAGVILGARLGWVLVYSGEAMWYLTQPWQIFNPFTNGEFVGIRGMSYHGAVVGFLVATILFCKKYPAKNEANLQNKITDQSKSQITNHNAINSEILATTTTKNEAKTTTKKAKISTQKEGVNLWQLLDLCALAIPLGYFFGRIGNFLNQELFGRVTDVPWGIKVLGVMRHPSQLYEAILEGAVVFLVLFFYRKFKKFDGELICLYAMLYTLARFVCEFYREPDFGLGFIFFNLSMGQILSILMFLMGTFVYIALKKRI
ncbi:MULTISPECIES: prolipoprotein diacylglyceryl transferase [unclassified Campylobacter]|uniref:prolipoprotein diacylglyceryl transferase n=1 Tax=unclassified Campylobacter TaxID=2593542 RepID=UPI003D3319D4